jgi:transcriptional regulator with XRE-family HTH domain
MSKSLHTDEQERLQRMLREARLSAGKTQEGLASELAKPQSFVAKYERGERRLDVVELITILRAVDTDPAECVSRLIGAAS